MSGIVLRFALWAAVGLIFTVGFFASVGSALWIVAVVLAAALIGLGVRSVRYGFFGFVAGTGLALIAVGIAGETGVAVCFLGAFVILGSITGFIAFGPRTSHAEPPLPPAPGEE